MDHSTTSSSNEKIELGIISYTNTATSVEAPDQDDNGFAIATSHKLHDYHENDTDTTVHSSQDQLTIESGHLLRPTLDQLESTTITSTSYSYDNKNSVTVNIGNNYMTKKKKKKNRKRDLKNQTINHPKYNLPVTVWTHLAFMLLGFGPSFALLDAIAIQIPYFQQSQPESLKIGTHMSSAASVCGITAVPLYYIYANQVKHIPYRKIIYGLFFIQFSLCLLGALFWHVTIPFGFSNNSNNNNNNNNNTDNNNDSTQVSIVIMLLIYGSVFVGNFQDAAIIPWISSTMNPVLIGSFITGVNTAALLGAIIGFIQSPGKYTQALFTPTYYFLSFAGLVLISLCAWIFIDYRYIRQIKKMSKLSPNATEISDSGLTESNHKENKQGLYLIIKAVFLHTKQFFVYIFSSIKKTFKIPYYWKDIVWLAAFNLWLVWVAWIGVRSVLPYAAAHVTPGDDNGEDTEAYAFEFSFLAISCGSCLSIFIKKINFLLFFVIYTIISVTFLTIGVYKTKDWIFKGSDVIVVVLVCLIRFLDGFVTPMIYKEIGIKYPKTSEKMTRWVSAITKIGAVVATWLAYALVESGVIS